MAKEKKERMLEIKNFRAKFDQPDDEGHFTGYASVFDVTDLQGDTIKPGAFKKTLAEKGQYTFLWQHNTDWPIGWVKLEEDEKGLRIVDGKLILDVQRARETRALMKEGAVSGISIGFETIKWEEVDGGKGRIISEIKLWEVSAVVFPAQPAAVIETVKSIDISKLDTDDKAGEGEMNKKKEPEEFKKVIPYHDYGNADEGAEWDGPAQIKEADVKTLKKICAWYDDENPDIKTSYKLPHHRASDLKAVWRGVAAAMTALLGGRGGVNIPESDKKGVYNHLASHYKDFEKEPPEFQKSTEPPEPEQTTQPEPEKTTPSGKVDTGVKEDSVNKENKKMDEKELNELKEKIASELKEKIAAMEKQIVEMTAAGVKGMATTEEKKAEEYRQKFWEYAKTGKEAPELKADGDPMTMVGATGGYLVPQTLYSQVIKKLVEYSPIRQYATVIPITADMDVVKEGAGITVEWPGETGARTGTDPAGLLTTKKITQHPQTALIKVSRKLLMQNTIVGLEAFISDIVARYVAQSEGTKFVSGNGTNQPFGLLATDTDPILTRVKVGAVGSLTFDDVKKLYYSVPSPARANGVFCMNDAILQYLASIKSAVTTGTAPAENIVWNSYAMSPIVGPEPNTIFGRPIISCPDMDATYASGDEPILFGDLKGYWITDSPNVLVQRLEELYAASGQVGFLFTFLKGGYPVDPQGLRVLSETSA